MALSTTNNRQEFTPTNGQTDFQFTLPFFNISDVKVSILLANGTIVPDSDFSFTVSPINGNIELGADVTITISPALTTSDKVVIFREVPYTQEYDLQEGSTIVPTALNKTFDRIVAQNQQQNDQLNRTVVFPETDPSTVTYTVGSTTKRANTALGFDNNGNVTELNLFNLEAGAADTSKGIEVTNSIIAGKVDNTTMQFDNSGNFAVKSIPFAKLSDVIDDDTMATATSTNLSTSEAIKAYIDSQITNTFPRFIEINGTNGATTSGSYWTAGSTAAKPASDSGTFVEYVNNFSTNTGEFTITTYLNDLLSTAETGWQSKCYALLVRATTLMASGAQNVTRRAFVRGRYYRGGSSTLYKEHILSTLTNKTFQSYPCTQINTSSSAVLPITQAVRNGQPLVFRINVEGTADNVANVSAGDQARIHIQGAMLRG
jgi:hypothetical protein